MSDKTFEQKCARELQRLTGERYCRCLDFVRANLEKARLQSDDSQMIRALLAAWFEEKRTP
jgi:hypothetical protein